MGGASGAPRLLAVNVTSKESTKNKRKHLKIYNDMRQYTKNTKIQASMQHGLYLFTCEIASVNITALTPIPKLELILHCIH